MPEASQLGTLPLFNGVILSGFGAVLKQSNWKTDSESSNVKGTYSEKLDRAVSLTPVQSLKWIERLLLTAVHSSCYEPKL